MIFLSAIALLKVCDRTFYSVSFLERSIDQCKQGQTEKVRDRIFFKFRRSFNLKL